MSILQQTKNHRRSGIDQIWSDLRHTFRQLLRSPVFTTAAVLTLALGIGATTAIFTLVQQVMMRSLPVTTPGQLWRIGDAVRCCHSNGYAQGEDDAQNHWSFFSWETYRFFRANTPAFKDMAAFQVGTAELGLRRVGASVTADTGNGEYVSGNFFGTLGISAWRGRLFTDDDDKEGVPPVAVMSFHTWQEKYGSDLSVIGSTFEINGHPITIIGVTPPGFFGAKVAVWGMPDFWLPLTTEPLLSGATSRLKNPRVDWLDLIGRVRPNTNHKLLEAQLRVELHQWLASHLADMNDQEKYLREKQTLRLVPGGTGVSLMRKEYKVGLRLLLLAALCVLLVACANIGNLLLARGLRNRQQMAVRLALGANRGRLVQKALIESIVLALIGGMAGIAVAYAGDKLILDLLFTGSRAWIPVEAAPSIPVLLFTFGVSVITGVAFGIAPAWMTSQAKPIEALRGTRRYVGGKRHWAQKAPVIIQVAVSLVLLSVAAMLGTSLRNLEHQNLGFDTKDRYLAEINPLLSDYKQEQLVPLFHAMIDRLRAIPGVRMVSPVLYAPMSDYDWHHDIRIAGKSEPGPRDNVSSNWTRVTPGFFEILGDTIVNGRPITEQDNANARPVAVINEAFAKLFFGRQNPVGHYFGPAPRKNAGMYEIVGVTSNMRYFSSSGGDAEQPMYFLPEEQTTHFDEAEAESREIWSHYLYNVIIWASGRPGDVGLQLKRTLANVDPSLVVYGVLPYSEVIHREFAQQNMVASLVLMFGALALALAAVGLYSVTDYSVEERTCEIGVRMALGANRSTVLQTILWAAFRQVGIGLGLGIPAAIGAGYLIASQLYGVKPWDPLMLLGTTLFLMLAAMIAAVIPATRAATVDPMQALRRD